MHFSCVARVKRGRKCIYDATEIKYLVQVKDDVEAGDEQLKELEQEMQEIGLFDTEFSLGDILEDGDDTDKPPEKPKKKLDEFPDIEGEESVTEYVGQYKRACLNRKSLLKTTKDRLIKDKAEGHGILGLKLF